MDTVSTEPVNQCLADKFRSGCLPLGRCLIRRGGERVRHPDSQYCRENRGAMVSHKGLTLLRETHNAPNSKDIEGVRCAWYAMCALYAVD